MLYEYQCPQCHAIQEKIFKVSDFPELIECPCGGKAKKIISKSAVFTDAKVIWMDSACMTLQREHERPIETRGEYKTYLKDNNLICKG